MFIDPMISEFLTHVSCMLLWISEFLNAWDFPVLQYWTTVDYRYATGKVPDFPREDERGSGAIFKENDPAEVEAELKAKVSLE